MPRPFEGLQRKLGPFTFWARGSEMSPPDRWLNGS
jgi:hypothetical protein